MTPSTVHRPLSTGTGFLRVCAWCPPGVRRAREGIARAYRVRVTHGICPACASRLRATLPCPLPLAPSRPFRP
jgi:hypothetical protein